MPKFMFVYRVAAEMEMEASPEELQESIKPWMEWIEKGHAEGWMVEAGDALLPEGLVVHPDQTVVDGPFVESKEVVAGYSVIQAEDLAEATEYAKICPMIAHGGKVEIRPLAQVGPPEAEG